MERTPPKSVGDLGVILSRRKYWIIVPFVIVVVLGFTVTPYVPRTYRSTTTVMIQPQKVPTAYVRPPSMNEVMNRIRRIQLGVMNDPQLPQVIDNLNLYPKLRHGGATKARVLAALDHDIVVGSAADSGDDSGNANAFTISYTGRTPQQAQATTKEITRLFIQENLREGHRQATDAATFLGGQVAAAGQQLAAQQAKIQAFKDAHLGSLPEQEQANLGLITQYQSDLRANSAAIDQDNQQRVYLESVLNVNPKGSSSGAAPAPPTPLQVELAQKQGELHADLLKYTPEHPDVIRLKHEVALLEAQIKQAPKASAASVPLVMTPATGPTQTDVLRGQLVALNTEIKARYAHEKAVQAKMAQLEASNATVPAVQTEFAALDSQYQEKLKAYNALQEKQQAAQMAAALYRTDNSEQFIVIQPANLPVKPYRPDPMLLYMGSVLLGLLAGFACAAIVELRDDTVHNADEAAMYLKLPVMAALPKFNA